MAAATLGLGTAQHRRLQTQIGDDHRQHQFVGNDHQHHADTGGDPQLVHDGNINEHDHGKPQGIHQQRQGAGNEDFAECTVGGLHRTAAGQHLLLPRVGHLHRVGYTNGENQERHQNRHRVDAQAQQRQQAQ
ncbi:hypothetical protein D3C77_595230 [compost metagenome]